MIIMSTSHCISRFSILVLVGFLGFQLQGNQMFKYSWDQGVYDKEDLAYLTGVKEKKKKHNYVMSIVVLLLL